MSRPKETREPKKKGDNKKSIERKMKRLHKSFYKSSVVLNMDDTNDSKINCDALIKRLGKDPNLNITSYVMYLRFRNKNQSPRYLWEVQYNFELIKQKIDSHPSQFADEFVKFDVYPGEVVGGDYYHSDIRKHDYPQISKGMLIDIFKDTLSLNPVNGASIVINKRESEKIIDSL